MDASDGDHYKLSGVDVYFVVKYGRKVGVNWRVPLHGVAKLRANNSEAVDCRFSDWDL